jgi:phosphoribosyl-ATP pyrophosphohydrolase/phosphoribosyl-AMP cyclohydrolase/histidinol dehydrogenase
MTFQRRSREEILARSLEPIPTGVYERAREIVIRVQSGGESALRVLTESLDGRSPDAPLYFSRKDLERVLARARAADRERLERIADRIRAFAEAQRRTIQPLTTPIPGGLAGHDLAPIDRVGCYAPGGRYPLPSSVLMTVIPARVAGSPSVWVASPKPAPITLMAAAVAGADGLLAAGGAHAIAAMAEGTGPLTPRDIVVGPGNLWVTAAKQILAGRIGIDLPAGPSELVIIADSTSDPETVAADLLAQAEHDPQARPILLTCENELISAVVRALEDQLRSLPTAETAALALAAGGAILCSSREDLVGLCDAIAPEHLQLSVADPGHLREDLRHYGALFIGTRSAEVFGDYGAGPNHVLPTGGAARFSGGLSVLTFLRVRTWIESSHIDERLRDDAVWLARQEGLEAHARAAERRRED